MESVETKRVRTAEAGVCTSLARAPTTLAHSHHMICNMCMCMLAFARGVPGGQRRVPVGVPRALGEPLTHHRRQGRGVHVVRRRLLHAAEALRPWRL
eukprot:scaffold32872_cov84-Phaeocystis_antarctica.AAC.8